MIEPLTREEAFEVLTDIFHAVFDNDQIRLREDMTAKDVAQWDSLNHINLIIAVEQKLGIKFKTAEVARMANVGEFVSAILAKKAS
jgi:acyl carrier protein